MMNNSQTSNSPKPAKTFDKQVQILKERGLFCDSDASTEHTLSEINYYRLRGYYIHLTENSSDNFIAGTSFEQIVQLHSFDSELRILLLKLLFDIEIVARTRISYTLGHLWGPIGYKDEHNYDNCNHEQFNKLQSSISSDIKRSKELFIRTHNQKYGGQFPIWVVAEVMSFGDLSKLYSLLSPKTRGSIASMYDDLDETLLKNWLYAASILRNTCAHNGRLYNRGFSTPIAIESDVRQRLAAILGNRFTIYPSSLFAYLISFRRMSRTEVWNRFLTQLKQLLSEYAGQIELKHIGFPIQWASILLPKQ